MMFACRLCGLTIEEIPDDSIQSANFTNSRTGLFTGYGKSTPNERNRTLTNTRRTRSMKAIRRFMNALETKKLVANRIVSHLTQVPANAMNELLKEPLASLEEILHKLATRLEREQITQDAQAQIDEMRAASRADGAWAHCLLKARLNGKVLADTEANRQMMEAMLAPHESPSSAIYETIALSYPTKFS